MTPQPQFSSLSLCSYHILSLKAPLLSYLWTYPWRRIWQPTPVFLPGEPRGQRSLAGYSPWNRKESDTTEVTYHTGTDISYLPSSLYKYSLRINCILGTILTL